ncbi:MAG: SanA/YdcF family protein [Candidatus Cyclobacteriaceae bacterium M2_1C_046]
MWVVLSTRNQLFKDSVSLPENDVALVLGTSNRLAGGAPNPYFILRMERAAELYKTGKVRHILVSGDNSTRYYNEPQKMKEALVKMGIPPQHITLDYAGLRTLDSIIRGKKIFGQHKVTIVTQKFHAYRALFISNYYNMEAVAMATDKLPEDMSIIVQLREIMARPLAIWDLYIVKKGPKFLGEREDVKIDS